MAEVVNCYITENREDARRELRFYEIQPIWEKVLEKAALCLCPSGKRHSHQRRIPKLILRESLRILLGLNIKQTKSFEDLHSKISRALLPVPGIGELTVYDIAHRIGAKLGLEPELIHLHAGTAEGARTLGFRGKAIKKGDLVRFDRSFRKLSPAEIEDCLCIYKADISRICRTTR